MRCDWMEQTTRWWARTVDLLTDAAVQRERVAGALAGESLSSHRAEGRVLARDPIVPNDPFEERVLAEVIIEDPRGKVLPLVERVRLARRVARLPWPELAQRLRAAEVCSEAELDQLLTDAGATIQDRLSVWGLSRV